MSKSLRHIHNSRPKSNSTSYISLHFNKADEEQLEISYGDEADEKQSSELEVSKEVSAKSDEVKDGEDGIASNNKNERISPQKSKLSSRDSASNIDSVVKDYWSRFSKRGSSLDCDLADSDKNPEQNESWLFFKDIKGKLTKTLEERKQKEALKVSSKVTESESLPILNQNEDESTSRSDRNTDDKTLQLSPAIEVIDGDKLDTEFESYVEGELERAKCEILTAKSNAISQIQEMDSNSETVNQSSGKQTFSPSIEVKEDIMKAELDDKSKFNCTSFIYDAINMLRNFYYLIRSYWNNVVCRIMIAVVALCFVPVPSWFSGFISGAFLSGYIVYCLLRSNKPKEKLFIPEFSKLHSSNVQVTEVDDSRIYKGWMNELPSEVAYNPETYHVNCTRSIYVRLDGSYLRVSYPQSNIPKRAMYNEPRFERHFIHQQHYDITGTEVELLPVGLTSKR